MKWQMLLLVALSSTIATAQTPDIIVAVDLRPTFLFGDGRNAQLRWFDAYGKPSTVGFKGRFADGNRFTITQRLARQIGNGDPDQVDEFYLESPGEWKVGKQELPFGQGVLYRETALALKLRTSLVFEDAQLNIALVDGGPGRPRGAIGRVGKNVGISFAAGDNFSIQDSAFSILSQDIAGLGRGRGYQAMYGFDTVFFAFPISLEGEAIFLREGQTPGDKDRNYTDLRFNYQLPNGKDRIRLGWAHEWNENIDSFRIDGEFVLLDQLVLMPHIRFGSPGLGQFGTTFRLRL